MADLQSEPIGTLVLFTREERILEYPPTPRTLQLTLTFVPTTLTKIAWPADRSVLKVRTIVNYRN